MMTSRLLRPICLKMLVAMAGFAGHSLAADEPNALFKEDDHCVAWETEKTMFLVFTKRPVGKSCGPKGIYGNIYRAPDFVKIDAEFRISNFDSGEPDRDEQVRLILKAPKQSVIMWHSDWIPLEKMKKIIEDGSGIIPGKINIGEVDFRVEFPIKITEKVISGKLVTTFSHFNIEPPKVADGWVATVKDTLTLHIHLQKDRLRAELAPFNPDQLAE